MIRAAFVSNVRYCLRIIKHQDDATGKKSRTATLCMTINQLYGSMMDVDSVLVGFCQVYYEVLSI